MAMKTFTLTLDHAKMISPGVKHFAFSLPSQQPLDYIPGQFITLFVPTNDKPLRRSYSIASIPGKSQYLEFAAGYVEHGPASEYLFALKPGDQIQASGPFGRLVLTDEAVKRFVFVATSTGVTPYRSMLPALAKRLQQDAALQVDLLLGVQTRADLIYAEDFVQFAQQHKQFTFHAQLSREQPQEAKAYEHHGYVQSAFPRLALDPTQDMVYLCGNPAMIDEAFTQLKALGFDVHQVRREKYISGK